jgi:hypothetical protein
MQGWLGLAATAALGVACARRGLALWQATTRPAERARVAAPLAALAAHAVEVQFAFSVTATGMMAWLCVAWLASESPPPDNQEQKSPVSTKRVSGRWQVYAVLGALLIVFLAVQLEGRVVWADTLVARARALDQVGAWKESVTLYDRGLALVPWQAMYHQFRAEAFYNLAYVLPKDEADLKGELLEAADRSLARARDLEPLEVEYYSNAGVLHAHWSETVDPAHLETAVAFYEKAFRLAPTRVQLQVDLGHVYHNHNYYTKALAQYRAALAIDPRSAGAHYDSGLAWLALDRADLAQQALQAALNLAPNCAACCEALQSLEE